MRLLILLGALIANPSLGRDMSRYSSPQLNTPNDADVLIEAKAPGTIQRSLQSKLRDLPVYPQDYGAKCDGSTYDQSAFQLAANEATRTNRPLHVGGDNLCIIPSPVDLTKAISIVGDGEGRSILVGLHNGPIFRWTVDGANVEKFLATGFTMRGQFAANADYRLSRGFLIQGDNTAWFQKGRFVNLTTEGMYAGFEINKATFTSNFGQESRTGFITFDNVSINPGSRPAHYGWYFPKGSGTGHTFTNIKTAMGDADSAVFRFEGVGAVVGDIIIGSGHYGGNNSALVSVGPGTVYRSNIQVGGSQLDAGMKTPFKLDPTGLPYTNLLYAGNNIGGGVAPFGATLAPVVNSIVDDHNVSAMRFAVYKAFNATANQVIPAFTVVLSKPRNGAPYTGTSCRLVVSGLVGGVDASVADGTFLLRYANGTVSASAGATVMKAPAGSFDLSASVAGQTVTLNVVMPAAADGSSHFDGQLSCTGGAGMVISPA